MGHFYFSTVKNSPTVKELGADLFTINRDLFYDTFLVTQIMGVPINRADDRKAKFYFTAIGTTYGFSITLLKDGRLEFQVPGTQWDYYWKLQQKVRRRLVRKYNQ